MESLPLFQQLDALDQELDLPHGYTGASRWLIPYADLLTLLLGLFVILFASVHVQAQEKAKEQAKLLTARIKAEKELAAIKATEAQQTTILEEHLSKVLDGKGHPFSIHKDARGVVISFQDRIFFQPGEAVLTPEAEQTLDKLADVLKVMPQSIRVEGHTDNTPIHTAQFPSNWELSTMRSTNIVKSLVEKHSFSPKRLSAAGFGEFYPLEDNSTNQGKQKNRRVDIVLLSTVLPQQKQDTGTIQQAH